MNYGEILEIIRFYHFDFEPRFSPFLLYVRLKYVVTFVRRCFRDVLLCELGTLRHGCAGRINKTVHRARLYTI